MEVRRLIFQIQKEELWLDVTHHKPSLILLQKLVGINLCKHILIKNYLISTMQKEQICQAVTGQYLLYKELGMHLGL